ncbi:MAG TPA: hypothetical protein VD907_01780 [Verrucomicrobiae bacterium]|nr:hypothetical protein [Verrucomicrobiae bacterium]
MSHQEFVIPKLARVILDTKTPEQPTVQIFLDPDYTGELEAGLESADSRLYLVCSHASAVNNGKLAAFIETAHHWDYNSDGKFDADHVIQALEDALWQSRETPDEFERPRGWYSGTLMRLMPKQPERHIVFGFGDIRRHFKWTDYLWAAPAVGAFIFLAQLQLQLLPWMKYSVVSGYLALTQWLGLSTPIAIALVMATVVVTSRIRKRKPAQKSSLSMYTYGFFSKAAVYEEQAFREGAENWNLRQRAMSCLLFGAIHMVNLIYPLASILPLALGGAGLMWYYLRSLKKTPFRRTAVLAAAVKHRLYNKVALISISITLVLWFGFNIYSLAFLFAGVGLLVIDLRAIRSLAQPTSQFETTSLNR